MNEVHTEVLDAMHNKSSSDREGSAKTDGDVGEFTSYGSRRRLFIFILLLSYLEICVYRMILPKQLCTLSLVANVVSCTVVRDSEMMGGGALICLHVEVEFSFLF